MPDQTATAPPWRAELFAFRFLTADDLPRMHAWLNTEHVARWWRDAPASLEETVRTFGPLLHGATNTTAFIAEYDGQPVGYLQRYFPHLEIDHWGRQELPPGIAGIDLFIGEPELVGRGFGPVMVRAFLRRVVFADPTVPSCLIDPDPANGAAIRAYEKVGFRHFRTIGPPEHGEPAYLMLLPAAALR